MRPPKPDARTVSVTLKLTPTERDQLTTDYGSPYKGLRQALNQMLQEPPIYNSENVEPEHMPKPPQPQPSGTHYHRRTGTPTTTIHNGQVVRTWQCECGHTLN